MNAWLLAPWLLAADVPNWREALACRSAWAIAVGAIALWILLPGRIRYAKTLGGVLAIIAAGLFASDWPLLGDWTSQAVFWLISAVTLGAAICTVSSRSSVYSAIWFALSLLGTAGLFFYSGAQFLAVATIVVYAGAIVVTFLFVIMLAQPEGNADYDRLTWGWLPKTFSVLAAATMVALLTLLLGNLEDQAAERHSAEAAASSHERLSAPGGILSQEHVATLGRHLFAEHLIGVELAGTLLLAALVGAIAIAIFGKPRLANRIEEALR